MTIPAILFGFLCATLAGAVFHLWKGGGLDRLILYLIAACLGFWAGHFVANMAGLHILSIGTLDFGPALAVCVGFLFLADVLFRRQSDNS